MNPLQERGDRVVVAGVEHIREAPAPGPFHLIDGVGQECGVHVEHGHIGTEAGQGHRGGRPDAAARAGHHRHTVREQDAVGGEVHGSPFGGA